MLAFFFPCTQLPPPPYHPSSHYHHHFVLFPTISNNGLRLAFASQASIKHNKHILTKNFVFCSLHILCILATSLSEIVHNIILLWCLYLHIRVNSLPPPPHLHGTHILWIIRESRWKRDRIKNDHPTKLSLVSISVCQRQ